MRWLFAALCLGICLADCLAYGQISYSVYQDQKLLGQARITQKLLSDGDKFVELVMDLKAGADAVEVRSQSTFASNGDPVRLVQEVLRKGKPPQKQVIVTFDREGAHVVVREHGGTKTLDVSLVSSEPRADKSEFWFIRDRPKPGAECKAFIFNVDTLQWDLAESQFLGRVQGGNKIHLKREDKEIDSIVDDKGYPISVVGSDGLRLVRQVSGSSDR